MHKVEVKFGEWIQKGFDLYKENMATLILVALLAFVLSLLTAGILAGPMAVGAILITLALLDRKEPKPEVGDLFKGFNYFAQSFLFVLVYFVAVVVGCVILRFIPCVGQLLSLLYMYGLQCLTMFALFHIADKNMEFIPAIMASVEIVKTNFWPFLGLSIVASVISSIGVIACGIGIVVTMPLYFCIISVAYREASKTPEPAA